MKRTSSLAAALPVLFCLAFILLWWNRYLAVTNDGWHFLHGLQISNGRIPYRDFFLFIPPLHPLKEAALIALFGNHLIGPQILGIIERLIEALVLFLWLREMFTPFTASLSTLFTMCLFLGDPSETLSSLHEEAVFFPLLVCVSLCQALRGRGTSLWIFLAGMFAGLSILSKQTSGAAATLAGVALFPAVIWSMRGIRRALRDQAPFLLGWIIPVGAVCCWLAVNNALGAFVADTLTQGTAAKGSLAQMLTRPARMIAGDVYERRYLAVALFALAVSLLIAFRARRREAAFLEDEKPWTVWLAATAAGVLIVSWLLSTPAFPTPRPMWRDSVQSITALIGEAGCLGIFLVNLPAFLRRKLSPGRAACFFIGGFSFLNAFLLSLSWPVFVSMLFPGFAFVFALVLSRMSMVRFRLPLRIVAVLLSAIGMTLVCWGKLETPFFWGGWREPNVRRATVRLDYPELAGMRVSPETAAFVNSVAGAIQAHSSPGDPIFVYPHIPIFYILAHRTPPTLSFIHFIDTTPDFVAEQDARRLLDHPPAVIVWFDQNETEVREGELNFRGGRRSGQRSIIAAIQQLSSTYSIVNTLYTPITYEKVVILARSASKP